MPLTQIYGSISNNNIISPNAVAVACDLLGLMIYDMHVMGQRAGIYTLCFFPVLSYKHDKNSNSAYSNGIKTLQLVKV